MELYNLADQQIHWLSQVIAKINRSFAPKKDDDSHTNVSFDALGNRIAGRWIEAGQQKLIFTLNLEDQTFEVLGDSQNSLATFPIRGKQIGEVESEIVDRLPELGLDPSGFQSKLHYEIPTYGFEDQPIASWNPEAIDLWKYYRQLANEACFLLLEYTHTQQEVRIWPHHFDTGIHTGIKPDLSIGFGLAMKDEVAGAPYFYMTGFPAEGSIAYSDLPDGNLWKWEVCEKWKGAFLSIDQIIDKPDIEQRNILRSYLKEAFAWYVAQ